MCENTHEMYGLRNDEERSGNICAADNKRRSWFQCLSVQLIMLRARPMWRILMSIVSRKRLSMFL